MGKDRSLGGERWRAGNKNSVMGNSMIDITYCRVLFLRVKAKVPLVLLTQVGWTLLFWGKSGLLTASV